MGAVKGRGDGRSLTAASRGAETAELAGRFASCGVFQKSTLGGDEGGIDELKAGTV